MSGLEVLKRAKLLIDTPEKWTKGAFAKNAIGKAVQPESDGAATFSIHGAIWKAAVDLYAPTGSVYALRYELHALDRIKLALGAAWGGDLEGYNDSKSTTHDLVMHALDVAIAMSTSAEGDRT